MTLKKDKDTHLVPGHHLVEDVGDGGGADEGGEEPAVGHPDHVVVTC